jgi:hypothetical protein
VFAAAAAAAACGRRRRRLLLGVVQPFHAEAVVDLEAREAWKGCNTVIWKRVRHGRVAIL